MKRKALQHYEMESGSSAVCLRTGQVSSGSCQDVSSTELGFGANGAKRAKYSSAGAALLHDDTNRPSDINLTEDSLDTI